MLEQVRKEAHAAAQQICEAAKLRQGQILVVGCSTSEVTGHKVGSYSSPELGQAIYEGMQEVLIPRGIYLAAQCCEHLNRAIIVEAEAVGQGEICNVVPQPKAGGSFATAAYHGFRHPVALEQIQADAGLDIGGTLIGMWRFLSAWNRNRLEKPFSWLRGCAPSSLGGTGRSTMRH